MIPVSAGRVLGDIKGTSHRGAVAGNHRELAVLVGTTVDCQSRVRPAEYAFERIEAKIKFLSCEPLRERIVFRSLSMFHWVIVGAQSKSSGEPAKQPLWDWVWTLTKQAYDHNCHVYWKKNLEVRPRAYPTV